MLSTVGVGIKITVPVGVNTIALLAVGVDKTIWLGTGSDNGLAS